MHFSLVLCRHVVDAKHVHISEIDAAIVKHHPGKHLHRIIKDVKLNGIVGIHNSGLVAKGETMKDELIFITAKKVYCEFEWELKCELECELVWELKRAARIAFSKAWAATRGYRRAKSARRRRISSTANGLKASFLAALTTLRM